MTKFTPINREYNAETQEAITDAKNGCYAGTVNTTSKETIEKSLF